MSPRALIVIILAALSVGCPPNPPGPPGPTGHRTPAHNSLWLSRRDGGSDPVQYYRTIDAERGGVRDSFAGFKKRNGFGANDITATYYNAGDLNLGRGMHCVQNTTHFACYVSNFGPPPSPNGFPNETQALADAAAGTAPFATVAMEVTVGPQFKSVTVNERDGGSTTGAAPTQCPGTNNDGAPTGVDLDTGLDVEPGDSVVITAIGNLWAGVCLTGNNGPDGWNNTDNDPKFPLPGSHPFALLGRIGSSDYFFVGSTLKTVHRRRGGRLFLRTNDDMPGNGTGSFRVSITLVHEVRFYVFDGQGKLLNEAALDTEGNKKIPGMCLACHGGRYVADSASVAGASFLPFDVFSFHYGASPNTLAEQQEAFRRLNLIVKKTFPNHVNTHDPIVDYINGLYPQGVETQGAVAVDGYVPHGWSQKPNVYEASVKHYCRMCHLALDESLDLTSNANFQSLKGRIENAVCNNHDMPHAEVPFNKFWQSSPVYIPGYLEDASVLGVTNCAQ